MAARQAGLNLVQYIAVRGDLVDKWPLGAIIAQACHASTAALHTFKEDTLTQQYLGDLDNMHKVVLRVSCCCSTMLFILLFLCRSIRRMNLWFYPKTSLKQRKALSCGLNSQRTTPLVSLQSRTRNQRYSSISNNSSS